MLSFLSAAAFGVASAVVAAVVAVVVAAAVSGVAPVAGGCGGMSVEAGCGAVTVPGAAAAGSAPKAATDAVSATPPIVTRAMRDRVAGLVDRGSLLESSACAYRVS